MKQRMRYAVTGALGGTANGLFGSGGGLFLVPLFIKWTRMEEQRAFATSVAVVALMSPVSVAVALLRGGVPWGSAWPYWVGGAVGGLISGCVFRKIPMVWLRRVFGALLLYGGIRAVFLL